jgi:small glutamine-rich tetratricopeptide repeat-containing protein alpha
VAVDPSYAKAYSRLGLAYYHLGRYEEAITEGYSKAVELDPSNASAQKDLANAKKKLEAFANSSAAAPPPAAGAPTDPFAAMMAGLGGGGGGGGGMPDMGNLMGMMQDPAIQQMAQQMMGGMGGAGGGGVPDLSAMMSAMGGGSGAEQNAVLSVPFSFETQSVAKTGSGQTSIELSSTNPPCFTQTWAAAEAATAEARRWMK